jgi:hypothetical protein
VAKKKVTTALVLSTEVGLPLQVDVPMMAASIPHPKVADKCWNYGLDAQLEAMAASIQLEAVPHGPYGITSVEPILEPCNMKV